jgi:hypothetical protein
MLVLLTALLIGAVVRWKMSNHFVHPTEWYGWTQGEDAPFDPQSPTRTAIIDLAGIPSTLASPTYRRLFEERCAWESVAAKGIKTVGREYRGVWLCNSAALDEGKFAIAGEYFETQVDELYSRMYADMFSTLSEALIVAVAAWFAILGILLVFRWANSGTTEPT